MSFVKKFLKNLLLGALIFFALISALVWFFQTSMIHHPSIYHMSDLSNLFLKRPDLKPWPDKIGYMGIMKEPEKGMSIKGTIVLFHGNAGSVLERIWYADELSAHGFRVILHEHPGYGARQGRLDEKALVQDGIESVSFARTRFGKPLYVIGESLGSGVAAGVISEEGADGAVLIVPWDKMANVAKKYYWYLPVDLLLREKYDSISNLKDFKGPLAVVMAEKDEIIPPDCARNLFDSFEGRKKLWISKGEGHNTWNKMATKEFWKDVLAFISGNEESPMI